MTHWIVPSPLLQKASKQETVSSSGTPPYVQVDIDGNDYQENGNDDRKDDVGDVLRLC